MSSLCGFDIRRVFLPTASSFFFFFFCGLSLAAKSRDITRALGAYSWSLGLVFLIKDYPASLPHVGKRCGSLDFLLPWDSFFSFFMGQIFSLRGTDFLLE